MEDDTMQQTFPAEKEPKVIISQVRGELKASAWDQASIAVEADDHVAELYQEGDSLMIMECSGDLELYVPADTEIRVTSLKGEVSIAGVRRVELEDIGGDVELQNIGSGEDIEKIGEAIALTGLHGELNVTNASSLRARGEIRGDASLTNVALVEIETVGGELSLNKIEAVVIGSVGADLEVTDIADVLRCGNVGGDCQIYGGARCEVVIGNAGGNIEVNSASSMHLGTVGGDCELREVQGAVEAGNVGGEASIIGVGGNLQVGSIGGDAELMGLKGAIEVGNIGGELELQATFPPSSHTRLNVGGDASVKLPGNPDLSIRAAVGGKVEASGQSVTSGGKGNLVSLVYGDGAAELEISVGGDLELLGAGNPRSSSASTSWGDFSSEMAELGREMSRLGQELSREIAAVFQEVGWSQGSGWAKEFARKMEEQARRAQHRAEEGARRAEERARRTEERMRQAGERAAARMRVRIDDHDWRLDPERLERIMEQARKATTEGISGALEAVERALDNLSVPKSPKRPTPPRPPSGPRPSTPPPTADQTMRTEAGGIAQEEQAGSAEAVSPAESPAPDLEQEREAILRMIAEGRISPEEGDMLLEGLGG
jgi:hypothetical protein